MDALVLFSDIKLSILSLGNFLVGPCDFGIDITADLKKLRADSTKVLFKIDGSKQAQNTCFAGFYWNE